MLKDIAYSKCIRPLPEIVTSPIRCCRQDAASNTYLYSHLFLSAQYTAKTITKVFCFV